MNNFIILVLCTFAMYGSVSVCVSFKLDKSQFLFCSFIFVPNHQFNCFASFSKNFDSLASSATNFTHTDSGYLLVFLCSWSVPFRLFPHVLLVFFFFFFLYVKCLKKLLLLIENCNSLHVSTYTIYSPKLVTPNTCSLSYMLVKIYIPHVSVCSLYIDISASGLHLPFVFQLLIYVLVYNLPELISYVLSEFFLVFSLKPIPILILISRGAAD